MVPHEIDKKKGVLIVAGHAIYENGVWHGGHGTDVEVYKQHVFDGFEIAKREKYKALIFSGGHTRPKETVKNNEADGMLQFAKESRLNRGRIVLLNESFARDSFENIFFSLLCYYREFGSWPSHVGLVSWKYKALRFNIIAFGLQLIKIFTFYGSGDQRDPKALEIQAVANVLFDFSLINPTEQKIFNPLQRGKGFETKRLGRMKLASSSKEYIRQIKQAYDKDYNPKNKRQGEVGKCLDAVQALTDNTKAWRKIRWPWVR